MSEVRGFARHLQALDPLTEVPPADLLPRRMYRATPYLYTMPSKPGDGVDVPAGARQVGQAEVAQRVGAEVRDRASEGERPDDLRPSPQAQGLRDVAAGLGEEERPALVAETGVVRPTPVKWIAP